MDPTEKDRGLPGYLFPELPVSPGATILDVQYATNGVVRNRLFIYDGLFSVPGEQYLRFLPVQLEMRRLPQELLHVGVEGANQNGTLSSKLEMTERKTAQQAYIVGKAPENIPLSATFYSIRREAPVNEIGRREIREEGKEVDLL